MQAPFNGINILSHTCSTQQGDASIPFCIVVGPPRTSPDGELEGVAEAKIVYDILGALVGTSLFSWANDGKQTRWQEAGRCLQCQRR